MGRQGGIEEKMRVVEEVQRERIGREVLLISVIVPVYNVAPFLKRCLDSVRSQTYPRLELLLVDDGSTDGSGKICRSYQARDPRFHYYYKDHGGVADARNFGLDRARGDYISFIDADDYVAPDYLEYLYGLVRISGRAGQSGQESSQKSNQESGQESGLCAAAMSMCSLCVCYSSNGRRLSRGDGKREVLTGKECIRRMCYDDQVDTCVYAKLYDRSLFDGIRFPRGRIFEDMAVTYRLFDRCDQVACGWQPKYYYMVREDSIVTSSYSPAKLDLLIMTDRMAAFVKGKYPDLAQAVLRRRCYARFSTLNQMSGLKGREELRIQKKMIRFLRLHSRQLLEDPALPWRDRAAMVSILLGLPFYRFVWGLYYWWQRKRRV